MPTFTFRPRRPASPLRGPQSRAAHNRRSLSAHAAPTPKPKLPPRAHMQRYTRIDPHPGPRPHEHEPNVRTQHTRTHARTHARTQARTHASARADTHASARADTHANGVARGPQPPRAPGTALWCRTSAMFAVISGSKAPAAGSPAALALAPARSTASIACWERDRPRDPQTPLTSCPSPSAGPRPRLHRMGGLLWEAKKVRGSGSWAEFL